MKLVVMFVRNKQLKVYYTEIQIYRGTTMYIVKKASVQNINSCSNEGLKEKSRNYKPNDGSIKRKTKVLFLCPPGARLAQNSTAGQERSITHYTTFSKCSFSWRSHFVWDFVRCCMVYIGCPPGRDTAIRLAGLLGGQNRSKCDRLTTSNDNWLNKHW